MAHEQGCKQDMKPRISDAKLASGDRNSALRVLYAWEVGAGFGHVELFAPLGKALEANGCHVLACVQNPAAAQRAGLTHARQAPKRLVLPSDARYGCHASIIKWNGGFLDASNLHAVVANWLKIFEEEGTELVIGDFAAAAMLAARIAGIRRVSFDTGFFTPALDCPFPCMAFEEPDDHQVLRDTEADILSVANQVLREFGGAPLHAFAELFAADQTYFAHHAALDVFQRRDRTAFVGPFLPVCLDESRAESPEAPLRAFVYLNARVPNSIAAVKTLHEKGVQITAYLTDSDFCAKVMRQLEGVTLLDTPADMNAVLPSIDFVVCHGGVGTMNKSISRGRPLLMLPNFFEQYRNALHFESFGAGRLVSNHHNKPVEAVIPEFLARFSEHREACIRFAKENPPGCARAVAEEIIEHAARHASRPSGRGELPSRLASFGISSGKLRFSELEVVCLDKTGDDDAFRQVRKNVPYARRVGLKDFNAAGDALCDQLDGNRFVLIDSDCLVAPEFFSVEIEVPAEISGSVWSWSHLQTVNGLSYNRGGVEIWSESAWCKFFKARYADSYRLADHSGYVAFGKTFSRALEYRNEKDAFRTGFNEVIRLGTGPDQYPRNCRNIMRFVNALDVRRLAVWMNAGADASFGMWSILGARRAFTTLANCRDRMSAPYIQELFSAAWVEASVHATGNSQESLEARSRALGEEISLELRFPLIEDWSAEKSQSFKEKMAVRRPDYKIFECNEEYL